jgi:hypothetical protein
MGQPKASVHTFKPGDQVLFTFVQASSSGRKNKHTHGRGTILKCVGGRKDMPAYEVLTPSGETKMLYANELRLK